MDPLEQKSPAFAALSQLLLNHSDQADKFSESTLLVASASKIDAEGKHSAEVAGCGGGGCIAVAVENDR
jgi:hypothetical protein